MTEYFCRRRGRAPQCAVTRGARIRAPAHYVMTPPDVLRRRVRDQPVDGPRHARRPAAPRRRNGSRSTRPTSRSATPSNWCGREPDCPTWSTPPTAGSSPATPRCVARFKFAEREAESARLRGVDARPRIPRRAHPARQRGAGRLAVGRAKWCWRVTVFAPTSAPTPRSPRSLRMPVISLELVDPRFYHLDTALAVLDDTTIAYYPPAFSEAAQRQLRALFPDAIIVGSADAYVLGLNAVSDGLHVVHPCSRNRFRRTAARRRFRADRRRPVRAAQGRRLDQVLHVGGTPVTIIDSKSNRRRTGGRDRARTSPRRPKLLPRCRSSRPAPRARGSPTSRAVATSTACPRTRRSTSATAIPTSSRPRTLSSTR